MNYILSQFSEFTWLSYVTFVIIILCWLALIGTEKEDHNTTIYWPLIIANISFWFFLSTVVDKTAIYVQVISFLSMACLVWFWIIRIDEKDQNNINSSVQSGKDEISSSYHGIKSELKGAASEGIGGGLLGELLGTAVDYGTRGVDKKLSGFLGFFESGPYTHPSRGKIFKLSAYLIFAMICVIFWL